MEIKTKYDVGQKVYWVSCYDGLYRVEFSEIKSINFGSKAFEKYEVGNTYRAENNLWTNFEEAKGDARQLQEKKHTNNLHIIDEYLDPDRKF